MTSDDVKQLSNKQTLKNGTEGLYRGNKENGTYEYWYENGKLNYRENYKDGELDGLQECWYENGKLNYRANWKNGKLDGLREWWYENGQLRRRTNYKNGKLDGLREWWYENGQLQRRENYKNGWKVSLPPQYEIGESNKNESSDNPYNKYEKQYEVFENKTQRGAGKVNNQ